MRGSMKEKPSSKVVAALNCIGLFGVSYGIFTYTTETRPWWLTGLAYVASILSFGALLELFKSSPKHGPTHSVSSHGQHSDALTDRENDLIGRYGAILERRKGLVGKESDLPASIDELRRMLAKAQRDPVYELAPAAVERCIRMLDTYVPDDEFEQTLSIAMAAFERIGARDEAGFNKVWESASARQKVALQSIATSMTESVRKRA